MKKQIFRIVIFLIFGVFLILVTHRKKLSQQSSGSVIPWNDLNKNSIIGFKLKHPSQGYSIEKTDGTWIISHPQNLPAREDNILIMLNAILSMHTNLIIQNPSKEDRLAYGLENPAISGTIFCRNSSTIQSFAIGTQILTNNDYYLEINSDPTFVYVVAAEVLEPFLKGLPYILDKQIFGNSLDQINSISFHNIAQEKILLKKESGFWIQTSPILRQEVDWAVRLFLLKIKNLEFDSEKIILNPSDLRLMESGIDIKKNPQLIIKGQNSLPLSCFIGLSQNDIVHIYLLPYKILTLAEKESIYDVFKTNSDEFLHQNS